MKRIFILLLMLFSTLICLGQTIYTEKTIRDKFDDIESRETLKTRVEFDFDNNNVIIEEKGKSPVVFIILGLLESTGSENEIVQLTTGNVYGYQYSWVVIRENDWNYLSELPLNELEDEGAQYIKNMTLVLTRRIVTTQYSHETVSEYLWIRKKSGERLIYSKQY